jgi:phosphonate transport system substrate-binding protein
MFKKLFLALAIGAITIGSAYADTTVLAINEGVTYQEGGLASERYKPLLEILSKELKRPVRVQTVDKYADLEKDMAADKFELVFVHPAHIGLSAVKSGNYVGLATAKGYTDYCAHIMVKKDSPLKSIQDLRGKKIAVPSLDSITTVMFTANLRQLNFPQPGKSYTATRYQDAVPFMIDQGFVDAGVTGSAAVAKAWVNKGGRIIGETKPIPIKLFLVSKNVKEVERARLQSVLLSLSDTDAGRAALAKIGIAGFVPWNTQVMNDATARLGL